MDWFLFTLIEITLMMCVLWLWVVIDTFRYTPIIYLGKKRKLIRYYSQKAFKELKLKPIPVKMYINKYSSNYHLVKKEIAIAVNKLTKKHADIRLNPYFDNGRKIESDLDQLKFTLFHEIGHYYTHTNYPYLHAEQHKQRLKLLEKDLSKAEYRQMPDEKMADDIAFALMKIIK